MTHRAGLGLLLILATAAVAQALTIGAEIGWGGTYRLGHWNPIFVTLSDERPRNVVIELYAPHRGDVAMRIRQEVAVSPSPATFVLYAPLDDSLDALTIMVRDPATGRRLAEWIGQHELRPVEKRDLPVHARQVIGISGRRPGGKIVASQLHGPELAVGELPQARLPEIAEGYDALDVLILNDPDLARLSREQQEAIIDWVRGGGHLLIWTGEHALPDSGPILDALPAEIGDNSVVHVREDALQSRGLPARFGTLKARELPLRPDAHRIDLLGGQTAGWKRPLGFGTIVVLPIDPSDFVFSDREKAAAFWHPLIGHTVLLAGRDVPDAPADQRRAAAETAAMALLGETSATEGVRLPHVAALLIALAVVGPLDWIVLRMLGRQPWTWLTCFGWIGLVAAGAVYVGQALAGPGAQLRSARLIDQADNVVCATTDLMAIHSPSGTRFTLDLDPRGWWQPLSGTDQWRRGGVTTDVDFHQDIRGNRPDSMHISPQDQRLLVGQTISPGPAVIDASLRLAQRGGANHIVGTISNRGQHALSAITIRTSRGSCTIDTTIQPGAFIEVERALTDSQAPSPSTPAAQVWDIAADRSISIDRLLEQRRDTACIYAQAVDPPAAARLDPTPAAQRHWYLVRAVVVLGESH